MAGKQPTPRQRHIPQRMCAACRRVEAKRGLVRLVRTPAGTVVVDPSGKLAGRGAYLCTQRECWNLALKRGVIERALRVQLAADDQAALEAYAAQLPDADDAAEGAMS